MNREQVYEPSLKGDFLIAMPSLADPNFSQTVTFMVEHTLEGAMGLVINRIHPEFSMDIIFEELELETVPDIASLPLHLGGPVHTGQVFILHGPPFDWEACRPITPSVALSNSQDIVAKLAQGKGPKSFLLTVGCAGWGPGQLEAEIMANSWLNCVATEDIIFRSPVEKRWTEAAKLMGIDTARLADTAGHA
jgi:putative transcriptional regulator